MMPACQHLQGRQRQGAYPDQGSSGRRHLRVPDSLARRSQGINACQVRTDGYPYFRTGGHRQDYESVQEI